MRVDGRWHRFQDGTLRPVIDAAVLSPSGVWQNITMLLDCGADCTAGYSSGPPFMFNDASGLGEFFQDQDLVLGSTKSWD